MADPADEKEATGPEGNSGVETDGNDGFADAFASFAAGDTPPGGEAPKDDDDEDEADDQAGQDGAEREDDSSPSHGDDTDPPADASADKAAAGKEAPDPWANATPAQIAERDRLLAERDAAIRRERGSSGRASGLQRQLNALQASTTAPPSKEATEGKGEEPSDAKKALDAKIAQLRTDYPEVAGPLLDLLEAQSKELGDLKGKVAPVIEADQEEAIAEQVKGLEAKHSDWRLYALETMPQFDAWYEGLKPEEKALNTNFRNWLADQPGSVQRLADSMDAKEVAVALTLFKTEQAEATRKAGDGGEPDASKATATDARRQRQLDGGRAVTSRTGSAASGAPDDFTGAFEHFSRKKAATG